MSDLFLYVVTVLIWGSTWFAITLQLGTVPPAVSVAWRFLLAAAILLGFSLLRGLPLRFSRREHLFMALQGLLLFCLNYVGFYISEQYLASGLVAVICSMLTVGLSSCTSRCIATASFCDLFTAPSACVSAC